MAGLAQGGEAAGTRDMAMSLQKRGLDRLRVARTLEIYSNLQDEVEA